MEVIYETTPRAVLSLVRCAYEFDQGYKYILCIIDVYSLKVWTYKMKNKDNINVFKSFKQFIKDSNIEKYKPTRIMSDHDSDDQCVSTQIYFWFFTGPLYMVFSLK